MWWIRWLRDTTPRIWKITPIRSNLAAAGATAAATTFCLRTVTRGLTKNEGIVDCTGISPEALDQAPAGRGGFLQGTLILMSDGTARPIEDLVPGDSTAGGTVRATIQTHYHAAGALFCCRGVICSGTHAVRDEKSDRFVRVADAMCASIVNSSDLAFGGSVAGTPYSDVMYNIATEKHLIYTCCPPTFSGGAWVIAEFADSDEVKESPSAATYRIERMNGNEKKESSAVFKMACAATDIVVLRSQTPATVGQPAGLTEIDCR